MIMSRIRISGVDQYLHENMTWMRALEFYLQENSYLKTRLSQVLDNNTDKDFIAQAEHFQNSFVHNDECIKDLKSDVLELQRLLKDPQRLPKMDEKLMSQKHRKLYNEMGYFEKNFAGLRNEFNQYLGSLM